MNSKEKSKMCRRFNRLFLKCYTKSCLDSSTANHHDTTQRIRAMFLGAPGLVADLRHLNPGRPGGAFDVFFEEMEKVIEEVTAAEDRRHGTAHVSMVVNERPNKKGYRKMS